NFKSPPVRGDFHSLPIPLSDAFLIYLDLDTHSATISVAFSKRQDAYFMNLLDYGRIILRRGWIAILLAVIAAVGAFGFSKIVTPVYRGTQTVLLVPSRSDLGLTEAALRLINSRQAYLNSTIVAQEIINDLQLDMDPSYLLGKTTIVPNRDSLAIQIDVDLPEQHTNQIYNIVLAWSQ